MDMPMVVGISIVLQLAGVYFALRLIPLTGKRVVWTLISLGIILSALREGVTLLQWVSGRPVLAGGALGGWVTLVASAFLVVGIAWVTPAFRSLLHSQGTLRDSEQVYREAIEAAVGVPYRLRFGRDYGTGAYEFIGAGVETLLGLSREGLTHESFGHLVEKVVIQDPLAPREDTAYYRAFREGEVTRYRADVRVRLPNGVVKWLNDCSIPLRDERTGEVIGSLGILQDITERKQAEEALRESEMRFRQLFENSPDAIFVETLDGTILDANPAACRLHGKDFDSLLGTNVSELVPPEMHGEIAENLKKQAEGRLQEVESIALTSDGCTVPVDIACRRIEYGGQPALLVHVRDITERRRAEESLRDSARTYREAIEAARGVPYRLRVSPEAVRGTYEFVGAGAEALLGVPREELTQGRLAELVQEVIPTIPGGPQDEESLREAFRSGQLGRYQVDIRILTPQGETKWLSDSSIALRDASSGALLGSLGILQDITERKRAEKHSRVFAALAEKLNSVTTLKEAAGVILKTAENLLGCDGSYVDRYLPEEKTACPVLYLDVIEGVKVEVPPPQSGKHLGEVPRRAVEEGPQLILRENPNEEYQGLRPWGDLTRRAASLMFVPIRKGGNVGGILSVQSYTPHAYSREDLETLQALADHCGGAWQRIQAEEDLRRSEALLLAAIEQTPAGIVIADAPDVKIRLVNSAALRIRGETRKPLMDIPFELHSEHWQLLDPDGTPFKPEDLPLSQAVLTGRTSSNVDLIVRRETGEERWILVNAAPVRNAEGEIIAGVVVFPDITERRRAEQRIDVFASLGARLSEATSSVGAARIIADTADHLIGWDACSIDVYDSSTGLIKALLSIDLVRGVRQEVPPPYTDRPCSPMLKVVLSDGPQLILREADEGRHLLVPFGDKARRSASLMFVPMRSEEAVIGFLSIQSYRSKAYDESNLQELQALADHCAGAMARIWAEEAHKRLATAIEQAAESVFVTDREGTIQYVNPAFEQITGYSREEAFGENPRILKSGKQEEDFYRKMWATLSRGEVWRGHFINRKKDGTFYREESTISPVHDASGEIVNYVAVNRDVTKEMELEAQLRQSQKMEAIGLLAGGVAHDFNNLLQAILVQTQLAMQGLATTDRCYEDLKQVCKAADRASILTRQLLAFSRRQVLQPKDLDLNQLVGDLMKMLRRLIGEHIDLAIVPGANLGRIHADPAQIEQVLMNLCLNSRDAMPDGGKIAIETASIDLDDAYCHSHPWAQVGRYVLLSVSDTGIGIPPEMLEHVFEPFFTTKEVGKGTGLGLATVYGIVKQHAGYIDVESQPGQGTRFGVFLPAVERDAAVSHEEAAEGASEGTETILLAEDDDLVRRPTVAVLVQAGYTVLEAKDGEEAKRLFDAHADQIDLALLDVVMPKQSGRHVHDYIKSRRPHVPILFSSGYGGEVLDEDFVQDGRVRLIRKPYGSKELLRRLRLTLDERSSTNP